MAVYYDKLWSLLAQRGISKERICEITGIERNTLLLMDKNESIQVEDLGKICVALNCNLDHIISIAPPIEVDLAIRTCMGDASWWAWSIEGMKMSLKKLGYDTDGYYFAVLWLYGGMNKTRYLLIKSQKLEKEHYRIFQMDDNVLAEIATTNTAHLQRLFECAEKAINSNNTLRPTGIMGKQYDWDRKRLLTVQRSGKNWAYKAVNFDDCNLELGRASKKLSISIDEMDFSIRTFTVLRRAGLLTIGDLVNQTEDDLRKLRNMGSRGIEEIKTQMGYLGLSLKTVADVDESQKYIEKNKCIHDENKSKSLEEI